MSGILILIVLVAVVGAIVLSGWKDTESHQSYQRLKEGDISPPPSPDNSVYHKLNGKNEYDFKIAGEAAFQDNLLKITGNKCEQAKCMNLQAIIQADPTNKYDLNAVRVQINNLTIGYLNPQTARDFKEVLAVRKIDPATIFTADAKIVGGWKDHKSEGNLAVYLDIDNDKYVYGL